MTNTNTIADVVGEDPRIAHLERTKAETERALSETANRADAAERMVAELRAKVQTAIERCRWDCSEASHCGQCSVLLAALASTAEVAGRWVSKADWDVSRKQSAAECLRIASERDAAIDSTGEMGSQLVETAAWGRAEKARADAAERIVVELTGLLDEARGIIGDHAPGYTVWLDGADAALASTAEVAGRWHSKDAVVAAFSKAGLALGVHSMDTIDTHIKRIREDFDAILTERDAAIAARDEAVARLAQLREVCSVEQLRELTTQLFEGKISFGRLLEEIRSSILGVFDAKAAAERARDEVGIQLAAAQAEIARLRPVVDAVKFARAGGLCQSAAVDWALRALDAVPGDALAPRASRFVAGCDVFTDEAHKTRAVTTWAARGNGPFWFVEDTATDSMCLVGGESMARRIAALLNGDALAPVAKPGEIVVDERGGRTMTGDGLPFDASTARRAFQCVNDARPEVWQAYYAEDEGDKDATVLPDADAARAFVTAPVNPDRITAALEASGIDSDNVKGGRPEEGVCGACRSPVSAGCLCPPMTDASNVKGGE